MRNEHDYIVVGAGHNGLSAGCTLALEGRSVLLVDRLGWVGGLSASLAWVDAAPDHLLSVGAMEDMLMAQTALTAELGLERHGYVPVPLEAPYGWIDEDGETLLLFHDFDRTLSEIRRFSPKDARTYADIRPVLDFIMDLAERLMCRHPSALSAARVHGRALRRGPVDRPRRPGRAVPALKCPGRSCRRLGRGELGAAARPAAPSVTA